MSLKHDFQKHKVYVYASLLVLVAIVSHLQWFNPFSILQSGDWQFRFDEQVKQLADGWGTWIRFADLGAPNIQLFTYPVRGLLWAAFANFGFSYDLAVKITLLIPIALGSFLIPYYAMWKMTRSAEAALVSAIFYGTTTYLLIIETRHLFIAIVYVLAPAVFYLFRRAILNNTASAWIAFCLLFTVGIFYELRIMYIVSFLLAVYVAYLLYVRMIDVKRYLKYIPIILATLLVLNIFWIIPTTSSAGQEIEKTTDRGLFGNNLFDVAQSFTIFRWSWTGGVEDRSFIVQPIDWYLWIVPVVVVIGLAVRGRKRIKGELLFFAAITLIGLLLTKQSSPPVSSLYLWLFENVPGFSLFREASKFYLITAFGYWGLLGYGLVAISQSKFSYRRVVYPAAAMCVMIVGLINLKPFVTQEIGALFVSRKVPEDYKVLQGHIMSQPEFYRTLWLPYTTSWGGYDSNHPAIAAPVLQNMQRNYEPDEDYRSLAVERQVVNTLESEAGRLLLNNASVKYIIIPLQEKDNYGDVFAAYGGGRDADIRKYYIDQLSKIDYLKRVDIGTRDVVIFENNSYRPYIQSYAQVFSYHGLKDENMAVFNNGALGDAGYLNDEAPAFTTSKLYNVFADPKPAQFTKGSVTQVVGNDAGLYRIFTTPALNQYAYETKGNEFALYKTGGENYVSSEAGISINNTHGLPLPVDSFGLDPNAEYLISYKNDYYRVNPGLDEKRSLGSVDSELGLVKTAANNLVDTVNFSAAYTLPDVESGQCSIGKKAATSNHISNRRVDLEARTKSVCVEGQTSALTDRKYIFSFEYYGEKVDQVGYSVEFNDKDKTTVKQKVPLKDKNSRTHHVEIVKPAGATSARVTLFGYKGDGVVGAKSTYANVSLRSIVEERVLVRPPVLDYKFASKSEEKVQVKYQDSSITAKNLISNPSFEQGLWSKEVNDCNAFDNRPELRQSLSKTEKSQGAQSLKLEAKRHTACTSTERINVKENEHLALSFDYKTQKKESMGYRLIFDDPQKTSYGEKTVVNDSKWQTISKTVRIPVGAKSARLTVYSYSTSSQSYFTENYYDNFFLAEIPNVDDRIFVVEDISGRSVTPKHIDYKIRSSTRTDVDIENAATPFYLVLAEAFHGSWKVTADHTLRDARSTIMFPFSGSQYLPENRHAKLNDFANGWYIDPSEICAMKNSNCVRSSDGTYTFRLVVEFTPQRWFHLGALVSGFAFAVTVAYLLYDYRKQKNDPSSRVWRFEDRRRS